MKTIGDIRAKMKSLSVRIACCSEQAERAKLEKQFSRLMTALKRHKHSSGGSVLGGKTVGKQGDTLIQAKTRVGFYGTRTRFVRGGSMSKK